MLVEPPVEPDVTALHSRVIAFTQMSFGTVGKVPSVNGC